jgi:hypothetical protein
MKQNPSALIRLFHIACVIVFLLPAVCSADAQVTLQWDPNDPAPQGYRLYRRTAGQAYDYSDYTDTGQSTIHTVTGLADNTTYYFVVRAYVGSEVSGDSNEVVFNSSTSTGTPTTGQDTNPPDQPYTVEPLDNAQDVNLQPILVSSNFYDIDSSDYHAESRWQIFRLDDDSSVMDLTSNTSLTRLTVPAGTLEEFTAYYWTVRHISQNGGVSLPSDWSYFTTGFNDGSASLSNNGSRSSGGGGSSGCFLQSITD